MHLLILRGALFIHQMVFIFRSKLIKKCIWNYKDQMKLMKMAWIRYLMVIKDIIKIVTLHEWILTKFNSKTITWHVPTVHMFLSISMLLWRTMENFNKVVPKRLIDLVIRISNDGKDKDWQKEVVLACIRFLQYLFYHWLTSWLFVIRSTSMCLP